MPGNRLGREYIPGKAEFGWKFHGSFGWPALNAGR